MEDNKEGRSVGVQESTTRSTRDTSIYSAEERYTLAKNRLLKLLSTQNNDDVDTKEQTSYLEDTNITLTAEDRTLIPSSSMLNRPERPLSEDNRPYKLPPIHESGARANSRGRKYLRDDRAKSTGFNERELCIQAFDGLSFGKRHTVNTPPKSKRIMAKSSKKGYEKKPDFDLRLGPACTTELRDISKHTHRKGDNSRRSTHNPRKRSSSKRVTNVILHPLVSPGVHGNAKKVGSGSVIERQTHRRK